MILLQVPLVIQDFCLDMRRLLFYFHVLLYSKDSTEAIGLLQGEDFLQSQHGISGAVTLFRNPSCCSKEATVCNSNVVKPMP